MGNLPVCIHNPHCSSYALFIYFYHERRRKCLFEQFSGGLNLVSNSVIMANGVGKSPPLHFFAVQTLLQRSNFVLQTRLRPRSLIALCRGLPSLLFLHIVFFYNLGFYAGAWTMDCTNSCACGRLCAVKGKVEKETQVKDKKTIHYKKGWKNNKAKKKEKQVCSSDRADLKLCLHDKHLTGGHPSRACSRRVPGKRKNSWTCVYKNLGEVWRFPFLLN